MSKFLKLGERILLSPGELEYSLEVGKVYTLNYDTYQDTMYMLESNGFELPTKLFTCKRDDMFIDRVIKYYNRQEKSVNVILSGEKGTGKTITMKRIAKVSGLPIILPGENFTSALLKRFLTGCKTNVCVLLDEIDKLKYVMDERLLQILDGVEDIAKSLILMTCNDPAKVSEFCFDRCSRVRYYRQYKMSENDKYIDQILELHDVTGDDMLCLRKFILTNITHRSIDNVIQFIKEYLMYKDEYTLEELLEDFNVNKVDKVYSPVDTNETRVVKYYDPEIGHYDDDDEDCECCEKCASSC